MNAIEINPWTLTKWRVVAFREMTYQACQGAPVQSAGTCDKCAAGIRYVYTVRGDNGLLANVGSDCVETVCGGKQLAEMRSAERAYAHSQYLASPQYAADKARLEARETARAERASVAEVECALTLYGLRAIKVSEACSSFERNRAYHEEQEILAGDSKGADGWDDKLREWLSPAAFRAMLAASAPAPHHHAAAVGTRLRGINCTLTRHAAFEGAYGPTYIETFVADDGAVLVWKGSGARIASKDGGPDRAVKVADRVRLTGTIKSHGEYNGQPQTYVTRCKLEAT